MYSDRTGRRSTAQYFARRANDSSCSTAFYNPINRVLFGYFHKEVTIVRRLVNKETSVMQEKRADEEHVSIIKVHERVLWETFRNMGLQRYHVSVKR